MGTNRYYILSIFVAILALPLISQATNKIGVEAAREKSSAALRANAERMNIIAENIANKDTTGIRPGEAPYRRKILFFGNQYDKSVGTNVVKVKRYDTDKKAFKIKYEPGHPAANEEGYVEYPNVDEVIEMLDAKETKRIYEANLDAYKISQAMIQKTYEIIRK